MTIDMVKEILNTRKEMAKEDKNTAELSLIYELIKITEEYEKIKKTSNK